MNAYTSKFIFGKHWRCAPRYREHAFADKMKHEHVDTTASEATREETRSHYENWSTRSS